MKNVLSKHQLNAYWSWNVEETGRCDILVSGTASKHPAFMAAITPDGSVCINIGPNATRLLKIEDEGVTAKWSWNPLRRLKLKNQHTYQWAIMSLGLLLVKRVDPAVIVPIANYQRN